MASPLSFRASRYPSFQSAGVSRVELSWVNGETCTDLLGLIIFFRHSFNRQSRFGSSRRRRRHSRLHVVTASFGKCIYCCWRRSCSLSGGLMNSRPAGVSHRTSLLQSQCRCVRLCCNRARRLQAERSKIMPAHSERGGKGGERCLLLT